MLRRVAALFALLLLAGCAQNPAGLPLWQNADATPPSLQYLGVGGYLLRWQGEALLFAPSFSNPASLGQPPLLVAADTAKIDQLMPTAADVSMLLVGHAHYDHLLDVPHILQKHSPQAKVYGSKTMGHILAAVIPRARIVDAESAMAVGATPGRWFYSPQRQMRAMAIKSEHAPHLFGIKLLTGSYAEDLTELPRSTFGWKEGQTLAWLVDLLDKQGRPLYRIHLALLGHWEDFFGNDPRQPQGLRLQDIRGMVALTRANLPADGSLKLPVPFAQIPLPPLQP
jgi:hypothetical protein